MANDSVSKTLIVIFTLCVLCSVVVSTAAVMLRPLQEQNRLAELNASIRQVAGLPRSDEGDVGAGIVVEARIVELESGEVVGEPEIAGFDMVNSARDPQLSTALASGDDIARIQRLPRFAKIYLLKRGDQLDKIVLPLYGYGLWSTLYGFIALEADANTVYGLQFYQHGETPGLGGRVDDPAWRALWRGKRVYESGVGAPVLDVIKGRVAAADSRARYKVDGLSGATITSHGVGNMIRFWFGERGYRRFLVKNWPQPAVGEPGRG